MSVSISSIQEHHVSILEKTSQVCCNKREHSLFQTEDLAASGWCCTCGKRCVLLESAEWHHGAAVHLPETCDKGKQPHQSTPSGESSWCLLSGYTQLEATVKNVVNVLHLYITLHVVLSACFRFRWKLNNMKPLIHLHFHCFCVWKDIFIHVSFWIDSLFNLFFIHYSFWGGVERLPLGMCFL